MYKMCHITFRCGRLNLCGPLIRYFFIFLERKKCLCHSHNIHYSHYIWLVHIPSSNNFILLFFVRRGLYNDRREREKKRIKNMKYYLKSFRIFHSPFGGWKETTTIIIRIWDFKTAACSHTFYGQIFWIYIFIRLICLHLWRHIHRIVCIIFFFAPQAFSG